MGQDWSEDDIGDQTGRVALVTGANAGIGYEAARALAENGARVLFGCRNPARATAAVAQLKEAAPDVDVDIVPLDLADLSSITTAVLQVSGEDRLDLLINNAGIMAVPRGETVDGFESQMGVNHLGHFALTAGLISKLRETGGSRVVTVSSSAHKGGKINVDDLMATKRYGRVRQYCHSKLANLLFAFELDRRLRAADADTISTAAHPGTSETELGRDLPRSLRLVTPLMARSVQPAQMGALPTLRAAVDPGAQGGDYYGPSSKSEMNGPPVLVSPSKRAQDAAMAKQLWDLSEELTGVEFDL
ncbi:MAG: oxidoreductase [Acidimicrobiales bacterium]